MASGAGGALNVVLKSILDPGDEVVIETPAGKLNYEIIQVKHI